jgi:CheY-like chemotaxis protein
MVLQKLLIAESNDELRQSLAQLLGESYQVCLCRSGDRALELLRSFSPDILYIDLMLSQIDGITVLQTALQEGIHPAIISAIRFESNYITDALCKLQVDYVVKKPCSADAIARHIREISTADFQGAVPEISAPPVDLSALLLQLNFGSHRDGYRYLLYGVPLFAQNPQQTVTKELYPAIGKHFGKTGQQVERSIRSATESAWALRNEKVWMRYFSPAPDGSIPRPTNSQMLHTLVRALSAGQKQRKIG